MTFPKRFVWGAATAAYQVEGGAHADGKGSSVWDMFCRKDGVIWQAQTGDVACVIITIAIARTSVSWNNSG